MRRARAITKTILVKHLSHYGLNQTVRKAIKTVQNELEKTDLSLLAMLNLLLNLDNNPNYRPYILRQNYMVKLSLALHLSLSTAYKHRERLMDMLALALVEAGEMKPFE